MDMGPLTETLVMDPLGLVSSGLCSVHDHAASHVCSVDWAPHVSQTISKYLVNYCPTVHKVLGL